MSRRHDPILGISADLGQFAHLVLQVLLVGLVFGMMRNVVPALGQSEFGVEKGSFLFLASFVVPFGVAKSVLNLAAGPLSDRLGRKTVLLVGWGFAVPVPPLVYFAPDWWWIIAATVLLGVNQGLAWTITQASKLDLARRDERSFAIGLDEFGGYAGVALAGLATGYAAEAFGARPSLLAFGAGVVLVAIPLTALAGVDTRAWARAEERRSETDKRDGSAGPASSDGDEDMSAGALFARVSRRDRRFLAVCQAGHVEKFVDTLVWVVYPVFLHQRHGLDLGKVGWIVGIYGFVWGVAQLATSRLSERTGRMWPNVGGLWLCGAGVAMMPLVEGVLWWSASAAITGLGMALLYPNLPAAISDLSRPARRTSAIGVYRFWRDLGYAVGALAIGAIAQGLGRLEASFWLVAAAMLASGALLLWLGEETLPRRARDAFGE